MSVPALECPVFVGGTGRSGTTIAARTLHHHPELILTRVRELRFITGSGGLIEAMGSTLANGAGGDPDPFGLADRLRGRFYRWRKPSGIDEGLYRIIEPRELDTAIDAFLQTFSNEPLAAARALVMNIMASALGDRSNRRWIDSTPRNVAYAQALHTLMPHAQIIHMMRDGRDVAVSFTRKKFGPDDPRVALDLWGERMLRALEQEQGLKAGVVLRVDLADWAGPEAEESLRKICDFLHVDTDARLEAWFRANVSADAMHPGRWRSDLSARRARALSTQYEDWCAVLRERFPGVTLPRST